MANAYRVSAGDLVHYLSALGRWQLVKVTSVTDQNNLVLAIIGSNRVRVPLNGGVAVPKRTTGTQTNVWRRY